VATGGKNHCSSRPKRSLACIQIGAVILNLEHKIEEDSVDEQFNTKVSNCPTKFSYNKCPKYNEEKRGKRGPRNSMKLLERHGPTELTNCGT
jgi:hypothetical protein